MNLGEHQNHAPAETVRPTVCIAGNGEPEAARALARELGLHVQGNAARESVPDPCELLLGRHEGRLTLYPAAQPRAGVAVDFTALARRLSAGATGRQPLLRALGRRGQRVLDATAGLGQDAFLMAWMGFEVTAVERSRVLAALVADGLARASADPALAARLHNHLDVVSGDAREILAAAESAPEVVYMDPMFPPKRRKSALARKSVQLIRALVGTDPDAAELLAIARQVARNRVVVKRPDHAPPLAPDPDASFAGKLVRYDVYVRAGRGGS